MATTKATAAKTPAKAKVAAKPATVTATTPKFAAGQCHYTGGWGDEANGFRKLVIADVTCKFPAAKGKTHCGSADGAPNHEAMYVAAAKRRASIRRAEADKAAGITKPQASAAAVAPKARKAKAPTSTPEERIARATHKSTPPAPPREPIARVKAAAATPTLVALS